MHCEDCTYKNVCCSRKEDIELVGCTSGKPKNEQGGKTTNHEKLAKITGNEEAVEIEALKMLIAKVHEDTWRGCFDSDYDKYVLLYKAQIEWLESEVSE